MLTQLSIRNFVLIDRLDIEFAGGMIALTGETGAGKSIVLDALGIALGARADSASVRRGEKQAEVTAEFDVTTNAAALAWLGAQSEQHEGSVILRRVIDAAGRSRAQINGRPASVAELRDLGATLLELHAQHEHQALLRPATQRELLDRYAGADAEAAAVRVAHRAAREAREALTHAQDAAEAIAREREHLQADLGDLRAAKPNSEEWLTLTQEQARLAHGKELLQTVESARAALADDDGIGESLSGLLTALAQGEKLDPALGAARQLIETAAVQLDEAAQSLRHYGSKLNLDPERLQETEQRLSSLFTLARKHRVRPEALQDHWQSLEARLLALTASQDIAALERAAQAAAEQLTEAAAALSARRTAGATRLAGAASAELPDLALPNAAFAIQLTALERIEPSGAEAVEFAFRSHASLPFAPLAKVASGGELARLSLAILVVCGDAAQVPTLVFDEVDVGVGGRVAAQVGRKLQTLAGVRPPLKRQVLCVTHMPQVAAHADHHYTVSRDNNESPTTTVLELDRKARLSEVARMLAGHEVGSATEKMAKELLATSVRGG
ncbi:MAG: DNA repair protein RecN [Burkholderiales bacterium]|nr:DNA repair protein RecN [Burkholderiales bacterium]